MATLGVDTSNYATSLALLNAAGEVVCAKKRFLPVKQGECGLRQSDAVFHHTAALPKLLAEMPLDTLEEPVTHVGVSTKPRPQDGSYMPCFLAGVSFATAFAAGAGARLAQTSHQQGHLAAALFATGKPALWLQPCIVFHISGGTTEMLLAEGSEVKAVLGKSLDLYAGQAVDRLGVLLGFPFPAGATLSTLAMECTEEVKPKATLQGMDCHLSGLENQCQQLLESGKPPAYVAKYCLLSVAQTVAGMVQAARTIHPCLPVVCAGGVMASKPIQKYLTGRVQNIHFVPPEYASDNAIGVALIAAKAKEESNG